MFIDRCYLNNFFFDRLGLQMGQLFGIAVKVEQLCNPIRLAERGVDVDVAVAAPCCEVLVPQLTEGDDLSDGLGMRPLFNRELVPKSLTKDDDVALSLAADEKLTLLTGGLHGAEGLMRFICVRNALRELIPKLQGAVQRGRDELVFVDTSDACDLGLMGRS